jgi:hypothetical protein
VFAALAEVIRELIVQGTTRASTPPAPARSFLELVWWEAA